MGVITIDDGNPVGLFFNQWLNRRQQDQQNRRNLAQQQGQFDATHKLEQERNASLIGATNAQTAQTQQTTSMQRGMKIIEDFEKRAAVLEKNGLGHQIRAEFENLRANNPDVAAFTAKAFENIGQLPTEQAQANAAKFSADQTALAAGGSQDAQARNFTTKLATGEQLNAPAFGDQAQRQLGPQPYGQYLEREGGARTTAGQELQANTQLQISRENNDAQQHDMNIGTFTPLTDQYGTVVGFFNAKTGDFKRPPIEGARRSGVAVGERENAATAEGMVSDVARVRELAQQFKGQIGFGQGMIGKAVAKVTDVDPGQNELYQIVDSLKNRILYLKSGKQINNAEYQRLANTLPDVNQPESKFFTNLARLENELRQVVARNQAVGAPRPTTGTTGSWEAPTAPGSGGGVIVYDDSGKRVQ